ncbi:sensor histidine kinase [Methylibium sp.]|uniref:sensor histidine kinase n=1 Tax=Methylibium sp. TaxID=2067992 RepID=UPI003D11B89A
MTGLASRFQRLPIRSKLLAMVLLPLVVVLPLLGLILLAWGNMTLDRLLITKVRSDLAVAQGYFERVLGEVGSAAAAVADSHALHQALGTQATATEPGQWVALLQAFKARESLDFINLRAPDGTLLVTDFGAVAETDRRSPAFRSATRDSGRPRARIEVLQPDELALLAPALQDRVVVPLVDTLNAAPTERTREDRAMVVLATAPVRDERGTLLGHVQAGVLLNRNLPFIDHVNEIVYPDGALPFGSQGTATLFLDDVRISTNVRLFGTDPEHRAIGTRVSRAVRDTVLGGGRPWLDRAFVVNDWYVSGYQPLADGTGRRVGMLYVGYLERPFTWLKYGVLLSIGVIFFAVMILAAVISLRWARSIFKPLEQMARTMQQVEAGVPDARVGAVGNTDEIGRLAAHLDHLLDAIDDKTRTLQRWGDELDRKVIERTRDLEQAQAQLLRSEKLATVGQLTAGIAHEVNNPIAVIQGNLDLLRELLGPQTAAQVDAELRLVDEQIERMRLIVTQLLQFARPSEYAGYVDSVNVSRALDDSLLLVGPQLARTCITVQRDDRATVSAAINRQELQQVLLNLLINALHAMPDSGTLTLRTGDWQGADGRVQGVQIDVVDTGAGLGPEIEARLFQPFVTTKTDGTGLGLWISRSLIERYGGALMARNRDDGVTGAVFSVRLYSEPPEVTRTA